MPRLKRRNKKAKQDDLPAWSELFSFQSDYFGTAREAGIQVDEYGRPDRDELETAWRRLGAAFMESWDDRFAEPYALREFGPPEPVRKRRR